MGSSHSPLHRPIHPPLGYNFGIRAAVLKLRENDASFVTLLEKMTGAYKDLRIKESKA